MSGESRPGRLDDATRELGLRKLRELRAEMRRRRLGGDGDVAPDDARVESAVAGPSKAPAASAEASVEAMLAEMALAAERERLERRVGALEAEVAQLRAVIAASIQSLAGGLSGVVSGPRSPDD